MLNSPRLKILLDFAQFEDFLFLNADFDLTEKVWGNVCYCQYRPELNTLVYIPQRIPKYNLKNPITETFKEHGIDRIKRRNKDLKRLNRDMKRSRKYREELERKFKCLLEDPLNEVNLPEIIEVNINFENVKRVSLEQYESKPTAKVRVFSPSDPLISALIKAYLDTGAMKCLTTPSLVKKCNMTPVNKYYNLSGVVPNAKFVVPVVKMVIGLKENIYCEAEAGVLESLPSCTGGLNLLLSNAVDNFAIDNGITLKERRRP